MRRVAWQAVLVGLIGVAAVVLPVAFAAWRNAIDQNEQRASLDAEPFRIAGNLYYVGTISTSVFLITGPDGHVLLDSAYAAGTIAHIATLGFDIHDVKVLLASDAHEGAEAMAELQQASGAALWASDASAIVIADGGRDPAFRFPMNALNQIGAMRYRAPRVDRRIKDGETIRVGPIAVTAHITAGSTPGCTSWSFPVRDSNRVFTVVSACSLTRSGGMRYPQQNGDLEHSFQVLRSLSADIWVTGHSRDWGRFRKFDESRTAKDPVKPFIDPGGYRAFIDAAEGKLRNGIFD
jgi:metallo-beta-lactamase class B